MFVIIVTTILGYSMSREVLPQAYATMHLCNTAAIRMAQAYTPRTNEMKSWGCIAVDRES